MYNEFYKEEIDSFRGPLLWNGLISMMTACLLIDNTRQMDKPKNTFIRFLAKPLSSLFNAVHLIAFPISAMCICPLRTCFGSQVSCVESVLPRFAGACERILQS